MTDQIDPMILPRLRVWKNGQWGENLEMNTHCISASPFILLRHQYYVHVYAQCNEGVCFIGEELENVTESIVSEGLVEVRRGGIKPSE